MNKPPDSPPDKKKKAAFSRRGFIKGASLAGGALSTGVLETQAEAAKAAGNAVGPSAVSISLKINGKATPLSVEPRTTLLDAMRNQMGLTGVKRVCDRGTCGACTAIIDGKAVYSCTTLAIDAQGKNIETIEGFTSDTKMHPVSAAFVQHDAQQCGYCTPGFVVAAKNFLDRHPNPSYEEVEKGLSGNLCRCGTYVGVRNAVLEAAKNMKGGAVAETNYQYPPMEERRVIGKSPTRVDGPQKSTGKAKYSSDYWSKDLIFGVLMGSPVAHGRIKSIDTSAAKATPGVTAVVEIAKAGDEIQWCGAEIAAIAAEREEIARDAVRKIKIDWEIMDHLVNENDLKVAGKRAKAAGEQVTGDPDKAFTDSGVVVSEGHYAIPVITHCCLESHGQVIQWDGNSMNYWPSTQNVSGIGADIGNLLKFAPEKINVEMQNIGGGFGSKFSADRWGMVCANLSQMSGGKPVKMFLDRNVELMIAGNRPSGFANIKVAAKSDGTLVAWQSQSWATGGIGGGGMPPIPYVFTEIPNKRMNHSAVATNCGGSRAWRAPNHPQAAYLTYSALEDLAAKLKMDPVEMHKKNLDLTSKVVRDTYAYQLDKASELMDWKKKWHQRGDSGPGPVVKGLGASLATWGGAGHTSKCETTIFPNGNVVVKLGSQDLGTGTRTIITQVAAETLGLPMARIALEIGNNKLLPSGGSGGSTTVGGVSASTRKSTVNALNKLFEAVAPALNVSPEQLIAVDQRIQVKDNASKSLTWQAACSKLGTNSISEIGEHDQRKPDGLTTGTVGGVQMAEVSVDLDTGVVKMVKFVAVHDVGLLINPRLAESQVNGAVIMGICGALMEERVMDSQTGRMLNADMEFYKLAGISDIGEIVAHMDVRPVNDKRGVIGLGEPCAVGVIAAIGNAVANAIGVRVPQVPVTPRRVLAALERRNA